MGEGLNRVTLIGNLASEPELRDAGGTPVLNMRVAATEKYKAKDGEWRENTEFASCVLWGNRATSLGRLLKKGDRICVEGRLQTRSWEKEGVKRYKTEVNVTNVVLLGGGGQAPSGGSMRDHGFGGFGDDDDSVPF